MTGPASARRTAIGFAEQQDNIGTGNRRRGTMRMWSDSGEKLAQRVAARFGDAQRAASDTTDRLSTLMAPVFAFADPYLRPLGDNPARAATIALVASLHVLLLLAFIRSLAPALPKPPLEVLMTVSGFYAPKAEAPRPLPVRDVAAEVLPVALPPPTVDDTVAPSVAAIAPSGTPDISMPSQAIASAHAFPPLPASVHAAQTMSVRLVLSIAEDGAVSAAQVVSSSGMQALDDLAVQWVKDHWHYRPAMRAGQAVTDTTTAIVVFLSANN